MIVLQNILKSWMIGKTSIRIGLALCYNVSKVNIIEVIEIASVLEVSPILLGIEKETILMVILYRMPGPLGPLGPLGLYFTDY